MGTVDVSDLVDIAADFARTATTAHARVAARLDEAAPTIVETARSLAPDRGGYPATLGADLDVVHLGLDVGPVGGGIGSFGHIYEYGSVNSAPIPHVGPAIDAILPQLEQAIVDDLGRLA